MHILIRRVTDFDFSLKRERGELFHPQSTPLTGRVERAVVWDENHVRSYTL